jgi:hypothetical protein
MAVAAAAAFLVAPAFTRRTPRPGAGEVAAAASQAGAWEAPDEDELWTASELASDDGAAAAMAGADELALDVLLAEEQ